MYSGVIGRNYYEIGCRKELYKLTLINEKTVTLRNGALVIVITKKMFQNWVDCKHQMYVRQVGEVSLPFPDEDC